MLLADVSICLAFSLPYLLYTFVAVIPKTVKKRETLGETHKMLEESAETLRETWGNIRGNGGRHVGNCH